MLWIGLSFDRLALEARFASLAPAVTQALVIGLSDGNRLIEVSDAAARLGLYPGMKRSTARTLAPRAELLEHDVLSRARQAQALQAIGLQCLRYSPCTSLQPPNAVVLEIQGSLRLFGGRERLVHRLLEGIARLGFDARMGIAPTATAAWLLARGSPGTVIEHESRLASQLACLPLGCLPTAQPHLAILGELGAQLLGDLIRLPRSGLARRFGAPLLTELDQALGRQAEVRRWFEAPPRFERHWVLPLALEDSASLLFACTRLLQELCAWLGARRAGARALHFVAEHDGRRHTDKSTLIQVELAQPSRDPDRWARVLRERLHGLSLNAPVQGLGLSCEDVVALPGAVRELFPEIALPSSPDPDSRTDADHPSAAHLLERLRARLGAARVQCLHLAADHRPERSGPLLPLGDHHPGPGPGGKPGGDPQVTGLPRPLWLINEPVVLQERNHRPWWNSGPLYPVAGPERIETGWWDGHLIQRDYFIMESESAEWLWVYRSREGHWYLHGHFG